MDPIMVRSGRHPVAITLYIGLALISVYGLIYTTPSVSVDSGLTRAQRGMFGGSGMAGALVILAGLYWRRWDVGLQLERIGQILMTTSSTVYVVALCTVSTFARSGLVTTFAIAVAIGSIGRIWQITRDLARNRVTGQMIRSTDAR